MLAPTASSRERSAAAPAQPAANHHLFPHVSSRTTLTVMRVGYLAPVASFDGIVQSVFARACNIACESGLLTLAAHELADGPTAWRLAPNATPDLRHLLRPGERLRRREAMAYTRAVTLDLRNAATWRPSSRPPFSSEPLGVGLRRATAALARHRRVRWSVIDREAAASLRSLEDACRRLDIELATAEIHRLVGWGEGLTPAGDDALVGMLASLGALARAEADKHSFLQSLSAAVSARIVRTTVISGHYLRLAAQGHFNADVTRLADALLRGERDDVREALEAALQVGATSGADMVAGMIAGFRAWAVDR